MSFRNRRGTRTEIHRDLVHFAGLQRRWFKQRISISASKNAGGKILSKTVRSYIDQLDGPIRIRSVGAHKQLRFDIAGKAERLSQHIAGIDKHVGLRAHPDQPVPIPQLSSAASS